MKGYFEIYPDSHYVNVFRVGRGLIIVYQLDLYERWIVHVRCVEGGLEFEDLFFEVVGKVAEGWLQNHFEDDVFEDWEKFAE